MNGLDDVFSALWPGAEITDWRLRGARTQERAIVTGSFDDVRNIFPWRVSTIIAVSKRRSDDRSTVAHWRDPVAVAALLTVGATRRRWRLGCAGQKSLVSIVAHELGHPGARGIVMCGPRRANRKPVVQLHDRAGRTIAFVKVAFNPLTYRLLDAESSALARLATTDDRGFSVPPVLGRGRVGPAQWLAIGPIGVRRRSPADPTTVDALALAIEQTAPIWRGPLEHSTFASRVVAQSIGLPNAEPIVAALRERDRELALVTAGSHGDFVPWNMLSGVPVPAVWDWERYETDVPVGFDRLHHRIQSGIRWANAPLRSVVGDIEARLGDVLPDVDVAARGAHLDWYLAQMLCRYESDTREVPTHRLDHLISDITSVLKERHP